MSSRPNTHTFFRDSGLRGDTVSESVVRAAPAALAPGAFASILISWGSIRTTCRAPAGLAGVRLRRVLAHTSTDDPLETAAGVEPRSPRPAGGRMARRSTGGSRTTESSRSSTSAMPASSCAGHRRRRRLVRGAAAAACGPPTRRDTCCCSRRATASPSSSPTLHSSTGGYVADDALVTQVTRCFFCWATWKPETLTLQLDAGCRSRQSGPPGSARLIRELTARGRSRGTGGSRRGCADMEKAGLDIARGRRSG